jgi:Putative tail fiber protein gp53-like, C-terminal
MPTLIDIPEFSSNEIYELQQADAVEGAAEGAGFGGIGISNQPHQQLANRTALLKQRQDVNIGSIGILQTFMAGFTGTLQANGFIRIPVTDVLRGQISMVIQWGYYPLPQVGISGDTEFPVTWPIRFSNAILTPPLASNVYYKTGGRNTVASAVSWNTTGGVFVLDVPNGASGSFSGNEKTSGFSWIALGF